MIPHEGKKSITLTTTASKLQAALRVQNCGGGQAFKGAEGPSVSKSVGREAMAAASHSFSLPSHHTYLGTGNQFVEVP